jgi:hypothetical protein
VSRDRSLEPTELRGHGVAGSTLYKLAIRLFLLMILMLVIAFTIGYIANGASSSSLRSQINIGFFIFLYAAFVTIPCSLGCMWIAVRKTKTEIPNGYSTFAMTRAAVDVYDAKTKRLLRTKDEPPFASKSAYKERLKAVRAQKR